MDMSVCTKSETLKQNIFQQLRMFNDRVIDISEKVGIKLFQEIFNIEMDILKQKIDYNIDAIEQECSKKDENEESESTRDTDLKKAECLIKMQSLVSMISNHISAVTEGSNL